MRDHIKETEYFISFIAEESERVKSFTEKLENGQIMVKRVFPVKAKVHDLKLGILVARYSKGDDLNLLEKEYLELASEWENVWQPDYYNKNIKMISLGVLFEAGEEFSNKVKNMLEQSHKSDWLYSYLLDSMDGEKTEKNQEMLFPDSYSNLHKTVYEEDKILFLKKYLTDDWYNEDCGCYEAHKSEYNFYYGYWSFEAGAIAKILDIDDSTLKDMPYYPYDLVHYKK